MCDSARVPSTTHTHPPKPPHCRARHRHSRTERRRQWRSSGSSLIMTMHGRSPRELCTGYCLFSRRHGPARRGRLGSAERARTGAESESAVAERSKPGALPAQHTARQSVEPTRRLPPRETRPYRQRAVTVLFSRPPVWYDRKSRDQLGCCTQRVCAECDGFTGGGTRAHLSCDRRQD